LERVIAERYERPEHQEEENAKQKRFKHHEKMREQHKEEKGAYSIPPLVKSLFLITSD